MGRLYIDYIHSNPNNNSDGGANYARIFVHEIMKRSGRLSLPSKPTLLVPDDYEPILDMEKEFVSSGFSRRSGRIPGMPRRLGSQQSNQRKSKNRKHLVTY